MSMMRQEWVQIWWSPRRDRDHLKVVLVSSTTILLVSQWNSRWLVVDMQNWYKFNIFLLSCVALQAWCARLSVQTQNVTSNFSSSLAGRGHGIGASLHNLYRRERNLLCVKPICLFVKLLLVTYTVLQFIPIHSQKYSNWRNLMLGEKLLHHVKLL